MRQLNLTRDAMKFLQTLPPKQFRQIVLKIFELQKDPRPPDSKPLKGSRFLRADAGEYRIVYRWDDRTLHVAVVGKRNDAEVYRKLDRMK